MTTDSFRGDDKRTAVIAEPRLIAENLLILKDAALGAVGVARLPRLSAERRLREAQLEGCTPRTVHAAARDSRVLPLFAKRRTAGSAFPSWITSSKLSARGSRKSRYTC